MPVLLIDKLTELSPFSSPERRLPCVSLLAYLSLSLSLSLIRTLSRFPLPVCDLSLPHTMSPWKLLEEESAHLVWCWSRGKGEGDFPISARLFPSVVIESDLRWLAWRKGARERGRGTEKDGEGNLLPFLPLMSLSSHLDDRDVVWRNDRWTCLSLVRLFFVTFGS